MTTPPVPSITDEQLEELEDYCARPVFKDDANAPLIMGELRSLITRLRAAEAEIVRLSQIINTPQADDFLRAVSTEAEHQRQRWGSAHDEGKAPADWFWLVGYLAGKALHAHGAGNVEKAEHHVITTAAALANWHRAMFGKTNMRPGIGDTAMERQP